jgi:hypothetical protein
MTNPVPLAKVLVGSHLKSALGMPVLPLSVMIVTASLPMGANVFMFAQRYELALATITLVMSLVGLMG